MPVGNDIVAWRQPRCAGKSNNQRFLNKVCDAPEREWIALAADKDMALWLQWSLKEAAYKLSCFSGNREKFHPRRYGTRVDGGRPLQVMPQPDPLRQRQAPVSGILPGAAGIFSEIRWAGGLYQGYSLICTEYIHSLVAAAPVDMDQAIWGITHSTHNDKNDYSEAVRSFARFALNTVQPPPEKLVDFSKDADGIPFAILENSDQQYISLSHDAQWLSFGY